MVEAPGIEASDPDVRSAGVRGVSSTISAESVESVVESEGPSRSSAGVHCSTVVGDDPTPDVGVGRPAEHARLQAAPSHAVAAANPREDAARALADAVTVALRAGDLVGAQAAAEALRTLITVLAGSSPAQPRSQTPAVKDLGRARRERDGEAE